MSRVDVAIPSFNYARYLPACVESVLSQGIDDIRVLIIDNASTDESVEVARRIAERDQRVKVRARTVNLGPHASFNAGVDWASATYMMILCADDVLEAGALKRAVAALDRQPGAAFAYGREIEWRSDEMALPTIAAQDHLAWTYMDGSEYIHWRCLDPMHNHSMGMVLVRTALQKQAGHYQQALRYYDDHEMMLRLALLGGVVSTEAVQGIRRLHRSNMSNLYNRSRREDLQHRLDAFRSFFAFERQNLADASSLQSLADSSFAATALIWATSALIHGRLRECASLLSFAASTDPSVFLRPPLNRILRRGARLVGIHQFLRAYRGAAQAGNVYNAAATSRDTAP